MAGSIVEKGKDKFMVRVYTGMTAEGKRKYHSKTFDSRKDAQKYLNKVLRERDTGEFIEVSKEYFGSYIDNWLKNTAKPRITEKTYRSYEQMVRLYLKPALADYKLARITPEQIQTIYNDLIDKGLSPRTVRYTHTVLRSALQQADKWGKINRNPADLVDLPKAERKEMKALSPAEAAEFMKAASYNRLKALFSLVLTSGIRPGEALGLRWQDVDLDNSRITINRALTRGGKGWKLEEPKTSRSRRTIPIPKEVMSDLEEVRQSQERAAIERKTIIKWHPEKVKSLKPYTDHGFVFATETGEPFSERNVIRGYFKPLLKQAGLSDSIRLYDLRHSCATLLLAAGENPKVVSERLGHASITLTLDTYSHVLPGMQESASYKLGVMLFGTLS